MQTMGKRIAEERSKRGLTQQKLAVAAATSTGVISDLERDVYKGPGLNLIGRVATALGVTIDHLAGPHGEAMKAAAQKAKRKRAAA